MSLHRCKVCGTRWLLWPDEIHGGGWNLLDKYSKPGGCCDNVAMGEQIEHLRDIPLSASRSLETETRPGTIHTLKCWPEFFTAVVEGRKRFEIRRNDRDFHVGDCLVLQEWNPATETYTREMFSVRITYLTATFMEEGFVALSIEPWFASRASAPTETEKTK